MNCISVVIPTFNHAPYIARAINSVRKQARKDTEILVVDDGSTDDTYERVRRLDQPISYIRTANRGPAAARNLGVLQSTGRLILFLDADDALLDGALESIRIHEERWPSADFLCGGHHSVDRRGQTKQRLLPRIGPNREQNFLACISGKLELQIGSSVFRRTLFQHVRFPENLHNGEDIVFFAQALARYEARTIDSHLVAKFDHENRLRNDTARIVNGGMSIVESLFDSPAVPATLEKYRGMFAARQLLTLSRAHYRRGEFNLAVTRYHEALSRHPVSALRWSSLRKYARSLLRSWTKQRPCRMESLEQIDSRSFSAWNATRRRSKQGPSHVI